METVTLKLPPKLLSDAARVASGDAVTVGHLVRTLLAREVARRLDPEARQVADAGLLSALQALLDLDIEAATDWDDLGSRLSRHGYALRPVGGGLVLVKASCGTRVCKGSQIGLGYRSLVRRFRAGMPDHPQGDLGMAVAPCSGDPEPQTRTGKEAVQRALGPVFRNAEDWETLISDLARLKYELRPMGTGLAIYAQANGRHVCNTATVGFRYRALVRKFGAPMPGHTHGAGWCTSRVETTEEFELIERD